MPKKPSITDIEFAWKVMENEGLDYALLFYFGRDPGDALDDPEILKLWQTAYDALLPLSERLQEITENWDVDDE